MKGKQLLFISQIKSDGKGVVDLSKVDMSYLDDTTFKTFRLSITNKTFIATNGINSYIVKTGK